MVRVHPGLLRRCPDTPTGRATRLKPECLQVRLLLWVLTKQRLGRQLADHLGLEPGMLWVRLPPEPLQNNYVLVEQPGVLATLSRWRSWVQIPSGTLDNMARYANRQSGEAQTFVIVCGFDSHPCYLIQHASLGHWQARGCNPPAVG